MTNQVAQNLIKQSVNSINTFYGQDLQVEEIDNKINTAINLLIRSAFGIEQQKGYGLEDIQLREDDFQLLMIKDFEILASPISTNMGYKGYLSPFPTSYYHLINDRSKITYQCVGKDTMAVSNNRLNKTENLYNILNNPIYGTKKSSPVSNMQKNILYVYTDGSFVVNSVFIDYIKKPVVIDTVNNPTQIMEFDEDFCYKIVMFTVSMMAIDAQQDPQKISFLNQENVK